jgi:hypothetical protein
MYGCTQYGCTYISPQRNVPKCSSNMWLAAFPSDLIHLTRPAQSVLFIRPVVSRIGPPPAQILALIRAVCKDPRRRSTGSSPDLKLSRESLTMRALLGDEGKNRTSCMKHRASSQINNPCACAGRAEGPTISVRCCVGVKEAPRPVRSLGLHVLSRSVSIRFRGVAVILRFGLSPKRANTGQSGVSKPYPIRFCLEILNFDWERGATWCRRSLAGGRWFGCGIPKKQTEAGSMSRRV